MSVAERIAVKAVRMTNEVVSMAVLIVILLLLAYGCYAIWDLGKVYHAADSMRYSTYKPAADNPLSFQELQAINPEVFAWLTVYGTHIDYPVVQGKNNLKYINTNALGKYALTGAIFLDTHNSLDFTDFNSIVYGHHMDKDTMFGEISSFADPAYFQAREYGTLYFNGQDHGLVFFAFLNADAYDTAVFRPGIRGQEQQQAYLDMLLGKAVNVRSEVSVGIGDRIVMLSTCSSASTNGRAILVGKLTDETYGDPFYSTQTAKLSQLSGIDRLPETWSGMPFVGKIGTLVLPFVLIVMASILAFERRAYARRRRESKGQQRR